MVNQEDVATDVPGTVYLVDSMFLNMSRPIPSSLAANQRLEYRGLTNAAHAGDRDVLLIPQPTNSPADPLVRTINHWI